MPSRSFPRLVACCAVHLGALLLRPSPSSADAPLPPPARYTKCSASGAFCLTSDPNDGTSIHQRGEPERALWTLPEWYRVAFVADDGEHLVTGFDGANLVPVDPPEETVIVRFWQRGRLLQSHTLRALGYGRDALRRTVSHSAWGSYAGFDSSERFRLVMVDGTALVFDVTSGELAQRFAPADTGESVPRP